MSLFEELPDDKQQHKFWLLSATSDILEKAISHRLTHESCPVDVAATGTKLLHLLFQNPSALNDLYLPQFAKIFVLSVKLDHLASERQWPSAFTDLLSLVHSATDEVIAKNFVRLIVKAMLVFDEEVVERLDRKPYEEIALGGKIKDAVRAETVKPLLELMLPVLQNYQVFQVKTVRGALKVIS